MEQKSFFASLFDFDFNTFITMRFLKVIYIVFTVLVGLAAVAFFVGGISQGGSGAIFALVFVPLIALFYLIMIRVSLEVIALLFRIGDNTEKAVTLLGGNATDTDGMA